MANTKSAAKRARQSERRSARNQSILSGLKTAQKRLRAAVAAGDSDQAKTTYKDFVSVLDKAAKRGVIHSNSADRRKSRFARALQAAAA